MQSISRIQNGEVVCAVKKEKWYLLGGGVIIGLIAVVLVLFGNPANMGFCIACFFRDSVGALGLHSSANVQYLRPEIIGLVLGSFIVALCFKEFRPRGGSSPVIRLVIGFFMVVGALVFLGCPFRMIIRLAAGDLNALVGLVGFIGGIGLGVFFLNRGFSLGPSQRQNALEGIAFPGIQAALLVILVAFPSLLAFSEEGPGSMRAPIIISLAAGLIVGAIAQRTRLCMAGGIRDMLLFRDSTLLMGYVGVFIGALALNIITGKFSLGFADQPIAHTQHLWNFLGMALVGFGAVLVGGCPLRQTILAGEGSSDAVMTVLGFCLGAAFAHNFGLASSTSGTTLNGRIAVILGFVVLFAIACWFTFGGKRKEERS